jgi:DNA-binding CsgD family transcriptional regulator
MRTREANRSVTGSGPDVFVGRDQEQRALQEAFDAAAAGRGSAFFVAGEPGIGKTALTTQLAHYARSRGGRVLTGHCYDEGSLALPYQPFVEALSAYAADCDPERLSRELGPGASAIARVVPDLAGSRVRAASGDVSLEDRWRLFQAIAAFLRRAGETEPVLLIMEDLHWADSGTLGVLRHLARGLAQARLLVVGTYRDAAVDRDHPLTAALTDLRRVGPLPRLELGGLSPDDVLTLLRRYHGPTATDDEADRLYRRTEGNPLFVNELLRAAGSRPAPHEALPAVEVPGALRDAIGRRLAELGSVCVAFLETAAVVGREFRLSTIARACDAPEAEVAEALEQAQRAAILEHRPHPGEVRFRFTHNLFREVLYDELSASRRAATHRALAGVLEAEYAGRLSEHAAELAEHFVYGIDATDLANAVRYYHAAAEHAMSVFAFGEATRLLERALEVDAPDLDAALRCDLLLGLARARLGAGARVFTVDDLALSAFTLAEEIGDDERAFSACRLLLDIGALIGDVSNKEAWHGRMERHLAGVPERRMRLDFSRALADLHGGDFAQARSRLESALALAHSLGAREVEFNTASILIRIGVLPAAEESRLFHALRTWPRDGLGTLDLSSVELDAMMVHLQSGERRRAHAEHRALASLASATSFGPATVNAARADTLVASLDGHLADAAQASVRGARGGTFPHNWRGRIASWLGDLETVSAELAWSESLDTYSAAYGRAFFLAYLGRAEDAQEQLRRVVPEFLSKPSLAFSFLSMLLEAAAVCGDRESAAALAEHTRGDGRRLAKPFFVLLPRHEAAASALSGDVDGARDSYAEAIAFCERVGYRPELALSRLDLAELLLGLGEPEHAEAGRLLALTLPDLQAMGMTPAAVRAAALLQRIESSAPARPAGLSPRQAQVLRLIADGKTNREIAETLVLSLRTVERHVEDLYAKIGARNRAEATAFALTRLVDA